VRKIRGSPGLLTKKGGFGFRGFDRFFSPQKIKKTPDFETHYTKWQRSPRRKQKEGGGFFLFGNCGVFVGGASAAKSKGEPFFPKILLPWEKGKGGGSN